MVVDPVDCEREDIVAGKADQHQRLAFPVAALVAFGAEDIGKRDAGHAASAEGHEAALASLGEFDAA